MDGPRRSATGLTALLLVAGSLTACGGEGGEGLLPTPTRSISVSLPVTPSVSPTRTPRPTETPTETSSETPTETPTETPAETSGESEPPTESPEPTPTPTEEPTESETPTEEPSPTETTETTEPEDAEDAEEAAAADDYSAPTWEWWLIVLLLLGSAIGIPLILWSNRRRRWRADVAACEDEVAWLARSLLPELRQNAASPDRVAGGWEVGGVGRATSVEDRLTALEPSAPGGDAGARVLALRDAVRRTRERLAGLSAAGTAESVGALLDSVVADLEAALPARP